MLSRNLKGAAENITYAIKDWLTAEVNSSMALGDVNKPLDRWADAVEGLEGGFEHPKNVAWHKHAGHMNRLVIDFNNLAATSPEDPGYDKLAANVFFDAAMELSGKFRHQCYTEASDQQDYEARRRQVSGISIGNTVSNRLVDLVPASGALGDARISLESLNADKDEAIGVGTTAVKKLVSIMTTTKGVRTEADKIRAVHEIIRSQYCWLRLAVDSIIYIAKVKDGELGAVPFMEPRSITEQSGKLWYPLARPLDWAEIMAANPPALLPGR